MSEINLATATQSEMKAYAANQLDLKLTLNMSEQTMRDKIVAKCKQLNIEPPKARLELKGGAAKHGKRKFEYYKIEIHNQEKDGGEEPVFVGFQGVGYLIPRGIPIDVPKPVLEILNNARGNIIKRDPEDGELIITEVKAYPFSVYGKAGDNLAA